MKVLKKQKAGDLAENLPDLETLVGEALVARDAGRMTRGSGIDPGGVAGIEPLGVANDTVELSDDHRARARSLLYDFAMRHFSSQVEVIRRDAVIEFLANRAHDGLRAGRLILIAAIGGLVAIGIAEIVESAGARYGFTMESAIGMAQGLIGFVRGQIGIWLGRP